MMVVRELVRRTKHGLTYIVEQYGDARNTSVGYEELIDGKPTGRIVTGWHKDFSGNTVYHYLDSREN